MSDYFFFYQDWAPLILRLALGAAFVVHGYPKLFKMYAGFAGWLDSIGIKPGRFWALAAGVAEFFGGIALILGVFTQLAAGLIAINMLVAMVKVKWGASAFVESERSGWELDLVYFVVAVSLIILGPGGYALESYLKFYSGMQLF